MAVAIANNILIYPHNVLAANIMPIGHSSFSIKGATAENDTSFNAPEPREQQQCVSNGNSPVSVAVAAAAAAATTRRRRLSKGKTYPNLKKSLSTPHMRSVALAENGALSPTTDKKRNKLGYHRTSVACGHCRRRKIRCLLAPDDPVGRCSNCIRLKKECNFFPVEQQTPLENKSKSEVHSKAASLSARSSPRSVAGQLNYQAVDGLNDYPLPSNGGQIYSIPFGGDSTLSNQFPHVQDVHGNNWPHHAYQRHVSLPETSVPEIPTSYWNLNEPHNEPSYHIASVPQDNTSTAAPVMNDGAGGFLPTEQIALRTNDDQQSNDVSFSAPDNRQRYSVSTFPPPLDTNIAVTVPLQSVTDAPSGSMSAPIVQSMPPFTYPQWTSYPIQSPVTYAAPANSFNGKWLHDSTNLDRVEEEMHSAPYSQQFTS